MNAENVSRETLKTEPETEPETELQQTFDREYVEQLRTKSANYRLKAKESAEQVDSLQRQLFAEKVARLDRVVDPKEVPYDAELLADDSHLEAAIDKLLEDKPFLKKRKAAGNIGQHTASGGAPAFSLLNALKNNAG